MYAGNEFSLSLFFRISDSSLGKWASASAKKMNTKKSDTEMKSALLKIAKASRDSPKSEPENCVDAASDGGGYDCDSDCNLWVRLESGYQRLLSLRNGCIDNRQRFFSKNCAGLHHSH